MTQKRNQSGFTIVELLIVIVVIGILAALVLTTFTGIQQRARNTERETDIKAIHGQLEAYYAQWGWYPSLTDLNNSEWRDINMKGLDDDALVDPRDTRDVSSGDNLLVGSVTDDRYAYVALPADCDVADSQTCMSYTLTAVSEGSGDNYIKNSLN